jgi:hypothetical protein
MVRKPLVLDDTMQLQQLQTVDDLDVPIQAKFEDLQLKFRTLLLWMVETGFELPEELLEELEKFKREGN